MGGSTSQRVALTGVGLVSPLGLDLATAWRTVRSGSLRPVRHEHRIDGETWGAFPVFRVEGFDARRLAWSEGARAHAESQDLWEDADLMLMAGAALAASADAGLAIDPAANDVGLVATHENPGVDRHVEALVRSFHARTARGRSLRAVAEELYDRHRERVYDLQTFMPLHRLGRLLGLHGHALFLNNACASGLYALDAAAALVAAGRCRAVLVVGADHPLSWPKFRWFAEQGFVAADGQARPFDRDRHGFVLGDGGAALVLEPESTARARGARPYAFYRGGGFTQEAWKVTVPDPASRHYETAVRAALAAAGIAPGDVDWLVAHGAATSVADAYEARTLVRVFGADFERPRLAAFKGLVGHNLGGSGVTETALLLLAMRHGHLPPVRGCETPDPALQVRPLRCGLDETPRFALKCAAGFGGFDAACVFERAD